MSTGSRPIQGLLQVVTAVLMKTMVVLEGQPSAAPCPCLTAKPQSGHCVVSLWSGKVRALQRSAVGDVRSLPRCLTNCCDGVLTLHRWTQIQPSTSVLDPLLLSLSLFLMNTWNTNFLQAEDQIPVLFLPSLSSLKL